jgi:hypothetical protein
MKKICKQCNKEKPYKEFVHKYFPPTRCIECQKANQRERNRKNPRKGETGWMDLIIGRS